MKYEPANGSVFLLTYNNTISPNLVMTAGAGMDWRNQQPVQPDQVQSSAGCRMESFRRTSLSTASTRSTKLGHPGLVAAVDQPQAGHRDGEQLAVDKGTEHLQHRHRISAAPTRMTTKSRPQGGHFNFSQRTTADPQQSEQHRQSRLPASCSAFRTRQTAATRRNCDCAIWTSRPTSRTTSSSLQADRQRRAALGHPGALHREQQPDCVLRSRHPGTSAAGGRPGAATQFGMCTGCAGYNRADIH